MRTTFLLEMQHKATGDRVVPVHLAYWDRHGVLQMDPEFRRQPVGVFSMLAVMVVGHNVKTGRLSLIEPTCLQGDWTFRKTRPS